MHVARMIGAEGGRNVCGSLMSLLAVEVECCWKDLSASCAINEQVIWGGESTEGASLRWRLSLVVIIREEALQFQLYPGLSIRDGNTISSYICQGPGAVIPAVPMALLVGLVTPSTGFMLAKRRND